MNSLPDLQTCDREPIHIPGSIQPHGVLVAVSDEDLRVVHASENLHSWFGVGAEQAIGRTLGELFGTALETRLRAQVHGREPVPLTPFQTREKGPVQVVAHRLSGLYLVEFERSAGETASFERLHVLVWEFMQRAQSLWSAAELAGAAAAAVRAITGFDRVMIYRFDEQWNGVVLAEDRNHKLPSYLGLWFPPSDIPAQARELYRVNRLRLIPDVSYVPVPVLPAVHPRKGEPLDMSHSVLRSVSPVHLEYMRNMQTPASMSISVVREGRLWGLISCHHSEPRHVDYEIRLACDLMGQVFSLQLAAAERNEHYAARMRLNDAHADLLAKLTESGDLFDNLAAHREQLLEAVNAAGVAVVHGTQCVFAGTTPAESQVLQLAEWLLTTVRSDVYSTSELPLVYSPAAEFRNVGSGLLAISISPARGAYILWFRPEVVQTVSWGGDPRKPVEDAPSGARIHPRKSFETWKEQVYGRSANWTPAEIDAAADLRAGIVNVVVRHAEELAAINAGLERANRELEAFSYTISHDLRAPFRHIMGYAELLREIDGGSLTPEGQRYLTNIIDSGRYAGRLVDDLLTFSHIGRKALAKADVDLNAVFNEARTRLEPDTADRVIEWKVGSLPRVQGDTSLLDMVFFNLLSNAVKFTRGRNPAIIEVSSESRPDEVQVSIRDNGVGFDVRHANKLFGVFERLHTMEEFEGTGIGLANVRRIVTRHGGRTWAEAEPGRGATFYFTLPGS